MDSMHERIPVSAWHNRMLARHYLWTVCFILLIQTPIPTSTSMASLSVHVWMVMILLSTSLCLEQIILVFTCSLCLNMTMARTQYKPPCSLHTGRGPRIKLAIKKHQKFAVYALHNWDPITSSNCVSSNTAYPDPLERRKEVTLVRDRAHHQQRQYTHQATK